MVVHRSINSGPLVFITYQCTNKRVVRCVRGSFVYDENICIKSCSVSFFRRRLNGNRSGKQCSGYALWAYFKIELCWSRRRLIWWTAFMCMYCVGRTSMLLTTCVLRWELHYVCRCRRANLSMTALTQLYRDLEYRFVRYARHIIVQLVARIEVCNLIQLHPHVNA